MPSIRVRKDLNSAMYFVTFTIKNWYNILDKFNRWDILIDSLRYCQKFKNLRIYAYVFMINHIHLIIESSDVAGFIRDFKTHTSKELIKNILDTEPSIIGLFGDGDKQGVWKRTNMPEFIETFKFYVQKKEYIENNPVKKGYVEYPSYWAYSSANNKHNIELSEIEF